jgi:carbamoyl-phosphate synthase large subunit
VTAVLFTCAGQRVDIVGAFRRVGAVTVAIDANPLAPALYHADHHALVPRIGEPGYLPALRALVGQHDVRLIVPLTDLDQVTLARARDELGALVLLPDAAIVERLGDKYLSHLLFEERGIASPSTWLPEDVPEDAQFPLLVKARHGFGSRHIYRAENRVELEFFLDYTPVDSTCSATWTGAA